MRYFARDNGIPAIRNLRHLNVLNSHNLFSPRAKLLQCQQALLKRTLHPRDSTRQAETLYIVNRD